MNSSEEKVFQTELDKQVEITILRRRLEELEKKRRKYFSWKAITWLLFIGSLFGGFFGFVSVENHYLSEEIEVFDSIQNSKLPKPIIAKYYLSNENYYSYDQSFKDTSGFYKYTVKEIEDANREIVNLVARVEKGLEKRFTARRIRVTLMGAGAGAFSCTIYYFLILGFFVLLWKSQISKLKLELVEIGAKELKQNLNAEDEKDFFTQLVKINFKYLDQYYLQTQEQADKSFWLSAIASIIGFLMIIAGIIVMYNGKKMDAGYVATSAGVISEFIAAVFFYLYNRTILKMSQYHQKLVLTQNISLALKTADLLKDSKEKVLENLIDRLTMDINKYLTNSN